MEYRPVSDDEIAARLASLAINPFGIQAEDDFRISIAGVQEKTAFLRVGNRWQLPIGPTPTSQPAPKFQLQPWYKRSWSAGDNLLDRMSK